jgi:effector-binding domain-containing protein
MLIPVVIATALTCPAQAASSTVEASKILAQMEQTLGLPSQAAVKTLQTSGTIRAEGMPGTGSFEECYLGADRVRLNVTFPGMPGSTQGSTGSFSWTTDPALGVMIKQGSEQASVRRLFAIGRRAPWTEMYVTARTVGVEELEGRQHNKLEMISPEGELDSWYVDQESSRLTRVDLSLPNPSGGMLAMEWWYSDWKAVDGGPEGCLYPHHKTQKVGVMAIHFEYQKIQPNARVTAAQVQPPADVVAALKDPTRRSQTLGDKGEFEVQKLDKQLVASVRVHTTSAEVSRTLAVILPEVMMHLGKQGLSPAGPPFSRYHKIDDGGIDLEAGMPVRKTFEPGGRVLLSELPAGQVATTWHVGPYTELSKTYDHLEKWMASKKLVSGGGFWEIYWTDPGIEPDPAHWKTQVIWPLE